MPTYYLKGKVMLHCRAYASARRTVDETVEAADEAAAKEAVIDRIVGEEDYDLTDWNDVEFNDCDFAGEIESVSVDESEAIQAYKQMQQFAVGTLFQEPA